MSGLGGSPTLDDRKFLTEDGETTAAKRKKKRASQAIPIGTHGLARVWSWAGIRLSLARPTPWPNVLVGCRANVLLPRHSKGQFQHNDRINPLNICGYHCRSHVGLHLACPFLFDSVRYLLWALTRSAVKTLELRLTERTDRPVGKYLFSAKRAWNPQVIFLNVSQHRPRITPFRAGYPYHCPRNHVGLFDSV